MAQEMQNMHKTNKNRHRMFAENNTDESHLRKY